jgi:hypothetical protein
MHAYVPCIQRTGRDNARVTLRSKIRGGIRRHFGETHRRAADGELDHWCETREGRL